MIWSSVRKSLAETSLSDKVQVGLLLAQVIGLIFFGFQMHFCVQNNKIPIRSQLYESEYGITRDTVDVASQILNSAWAVVPAEIKGYDYAYALLSAVTNNESALQARNAEQLYNSMFGISAFKNEQHIENTTNTRRVFLYIQNVFYHAHNSFDYYQDNIISESEFSTWKNTIQEMNAHPILIAVIWQGYRHLYYSRKFAIFLQEELCAAKAPPGSRGNNDYQRNRDFIRLYYADMCNDGWPDALPDY